ncbi:division plane positioning ATPase MipZ [Candidatus Hydrogenosomobacter endosymbioticus]|nr:division plane positioning ATPase MipZ [Candidatus Hydrogenosomobacter endosymbioticus]
MSNFSENNSSSYVIIFSNEKGGTGKSTLAVHVVIALLYAGYKVVSVDIDGRQGTFSRYMENRSMLGNRASNRVPVPVHFRIVDDTPGVDTQEELCKIVSSAGADFVVIDSRGADSGLVRYAHSLADLVVSPINDSYIDLDLFIKLSDINNGFSPNVYAQMIWEQKLKRASKSGKSLSWLVVRNRLQGMASNNSKKVEEILELLAKKLGFKLVSGFRERTIFRELFLSGLTLLDKKTGVARGLSHVAAKQELRALLNSIISESKVGKRNF